MGSLDKQENKEFIDIKSIYEQYIKYWPVLVFSVLISVVLGLLYAEFAPPKMQVNANILIKEEESSSGASGMAAVQSMALSNMLGMGGTSVNDELILLNSYSLLRSVGRDLGLNVIYKKKKFPFDVDYYKNSPIKIYATKDLDESLRAYLKFFVEIEDQECSVKVKFNWRTLAKVKTKEFPVKLETKYGTFYLDTTQYYKPNKPLDMEIHYMGYDLATEILQKRLLIDQVSKKANVISLQIVDHNMFRGKEILNVLVDRYNKNGDLDKNIEASRMENFLGERIRLMENELSDVEKAIEKYKKENNLTDIESEAKIILEKSQDFKEKLIEAEAQYTVIELVEEFLTKPENQYSLVPMNIGLSDRTVLQGLSDYNDALLQRVGLLHTSRAENPELEVMNAQINVMRANMLETVRSIKSGYSRSRDDLLKQERFFLDKIENLPQQEREYLTIKRQQMIKQELFLLLLQKREENALTQALVKPKAKIVDNAYVLSEPVSPKKMVVLVISIILAFVFTTCYIVCDKLIVKRIVRK